MLFALAMMTVTVQPGSTLSGIARSHGISTAAVEAANPQFSADYDLIYPGQEVSIPSGTASPSDIHGAYHPSPAPSAAHSEPPRQQRQQRQSQGTASAPSGASAYQRCVIARESGGSSQVMNASGHYGLYQFSAPTWAAAGGSPADFGRASVAEQDRVFARAYALWGTQPWTPSDGC